jgi:C4-dicarboxylate-specific signal transduction histidine kinase
MKPPMEKWLFLDDQASEREIMNIVVGDISHGIKLYLAGTISEARDILKRNAISVTTEFCAEKLLVSVNAQEFQQVFLNLVKNACDAMEHQGGQRKISISTECKSSHLI